MIERVGNCRIIDEIGSGGMAVVYKGIQESLKRTVAIKALKTSVSSDKDVVKRFEREAMSIASFQHENIITVYDFFQERGALFIIMEFVEGIDLYDLLDRTGKIPYDIAAIISLQVARALDYAHFRGVIHRDVKPANIIISKLGTVKLSDFGIARVEESDLTEYGVGLGTPAYMSPEQALGGRLDHRSDIFSLGIVLYQMITGNKPFQDDTERSALEKIREDIPPPPRTIAPNVPKILERIIFRCIEKSADDRFGSTQELVVALEQFLASTVNQNYRARLMLFMQQQNIITLEESQSTLHPALIGTYMGRIPLFRLRRRTRRFLLFSGMLLFVVPFLGGLFWKLGSSALPQQSQASQKKCPSTVHAPVPTGMLKVTAYPWARVDIDGKHRFTTPYNSPLTLPVGKHQVRFTNPFFTTVEKTIHIKKGKLTTLSIALQRIERTTDEKNPRGSSQ